MSVEHTFVSKDGLETRVLTKAKAIRAKCLDCACYQLAEISRCRVPNCPLFPFRFGNEKGLDKDKIAHLTKNKTEEEEWEDSWEDEDEEDEE